MWYADVNKCFFIAALSFVCCYCKTTGPMQPPQETSALAGFMDHQFHLSLALMPGKNLYRFEVCTVASSIKKCSAAFLTDDDKDVTFTLHTIALHKMHENVVDGHQSLAERWSRFLAEMDEDTKMQYAKYGLATAFTAGTVGVVVHAGVVRQKALGFRVPIYFSGNGYSDTMSSNLMHHLYAHANQEVKNKLNHSFDEAMTKTRTVPCMFKQFITKRGTIKDAIAPKHWNQFVQYVADERGIEATSESVIRFSNKHYNWAYQDFLGFVRYHGVSPNHLAKLTGVSRKVTPLLRNKKMRLIAGIVLVTSFIVNRNDAMANVHYLQATPADGHVMTESPETQQAVREQGEMPVLIESLGSLFAVDNQQTESVESVEVMLQHLGSYLQATSVDYNSIPPYKYCLPSLSAERDEAECYVIAL